MTFALPERAKALLLSFLLLFAFLGAWEFAIPRAGDAGQLSEYELLSGGGAPQASVPPPSQIIRKAVEEATEPTTFAIGTEVNMVNRLAEEHPQHTIFCLDPVICPCSTMYRIHPGYLAWVLEELVAGRAPNVIRVSDEVAEHAKVALERMLAAKPKTTGD